jgi:hypothetical protein
MKRVSLLCILVAGYFVTATADDPGQPDSLLIGFQDSFIRDEIIVGLGQTVVIPVWLKTDDSVSFVHIPVSTHDNYVTSREGGNLYEPLSLFDDIGFLPPENDRPFQDYTSQSILGFAYLASSANDFWDILPYFLDYWWFHVADFIVTTTTDTSALGDETALIEGNNSRNGGLLFGLINGDSFEPRAVYGSLHFVSYLSGDANGDRGVNGIDVVYLVAYLMGHGQEPFPILRGDANADCVINGLDILYLVNYLKGLGPVPLYGNCWNN